MKSMEKLLMKKKDNSEDGPPMDGSEMQAKMDVLHELMELAQNEMGDRLKSGMDEHMQKVSVMSPNKEGMAEGLKKAEEMVSSSPEMMSSDDHDDDSGSNDHHSAEQEYKKSMLDHDNESGPEAAHKMAELAGMDQPGEKQMDHEIESKDKEEPEQMQRREKEQDKNRKGMKESPKRKRLFDMSSDEE